MDPSLPPPFTAFPPFTNSNAYAPSQHPFYGAVAAPAPSHPSVNHPHYSEMICSAISALNEAEGSSKQAISRYIERFYTGIPPAHGALLTHHLRTLKNSGVLVMVKKSYKLASAAPSPPPHRSDFNNIVNENQPLPVPAATSAPQTQKRGRGRGRPPKANGTPTMVSRPGEQIQPQPSIKRPPGRPRKDGASPTVNSPVPGGEEIEKRRGRPPSGRAAGRERKPTVVSAPASVFPYVANGGVRRRGRPRRVDAGASSEKIAKRGRGRPPKVGGVIRKPMKPMRVGYFPTGRPVGRPRKNAASNGAFGQQDISYGELKKKFELFQEKTKQIVNVLKAEVGGSQNQTVVQAIHDLEELTVTKTETTEEPHRIEEMQPDEQRPGNEPQTEAEGYSQGHAQTETEVMQESLF